MGLIREYVQTGDDDVKKYLLEIFGQENVYSCPYPSFNCFCTFVCPKINVPFEIFIPTMIILKKDCVVLEGGTYRIAKHIEENSRHILFFQKLERWGWVDFIECIGGWAEGSRIDWRGIRPAQAGLTL
jgi:hypothetical protein